MPIRRTIKNVVKNYTPAEVKVREATCNDQWGPNTTLMNEIADLTHSSLARGEIMNMIWKRLSDTGKNWRHVIKGLSLLEYLAKVGSPQVAEACKCHIHLISMLNDFQFYENGVDHGMVIREKSKNFVSLLRDSERFKNERQKALNTKDKLSHSTGLGSTGGRIPHSVSDRYLSTSDRLGGSQRHVPAASALSPDLEAVRPSSFGEEDLQLQLALAMSKEEHSEEVKKRKGDDLKLKMAIEESTKANSELQTTVGKLEQALSLGSTPKSHAYPFLPPPNQQSSKQASPWNELDAPSYQAQDPFNTPSNSTPWSPASNQSDAFVPNPISQSDAFSLNATTQSYSFTQNSTTQSNVFLPEIGSQSQVSKDPWAPLDSALAANSADIFQQSFGNHNSNYPNTQSQPQQLQSQLSLLQQQQQQPLVPHQPPLQPQQPPVDIDNEFDMLVRRSEAITASSNPNHHDQSLGTLEDDFLGLGGGMLGGEKVGGKSGWEKGQEDKKGKEAESLVSDFLGENAKLVDLEQLISKPPPSTLTNPFSMTPYNPDSISGTSTQPNYHLLIPNIKNQPTSSQNLHQNQPFSQPFPTNQPFSQPFPTNQPFYQNQSNQNQNVAPQNGASHANPFL